MLLTPATEADIEEIVALVNLAFRGTGISASWNTESEFIQGPRLTAPLLREDLAKKPHAVLLLFRENAQGELAGAVWLEPRPRAVWYLGLLSVRPDRQNQQLGRRLLAATETYAREHGARRIRMSVVNVRTTLLAWYVRRGYQLTGETEPFPYTDERFGKPLRDDLCFVFLEKPIL